MAGKGVRVVSTAETLLEAVVKDYLCEEGRLSDIRDDQGKTVFRVPKDGAATSDAVEMNYVFLLQYFATFAEEGVPKLTVFKVVFYRCALQYGLFPPRTRKRTIKEWAAYTGAVCRQICVHTMKLCSRSSGSRKMRIQGLKTLIRSVIGETADDEIARQLVQLESDKKDEDSGLSSSTEGSPEAAVQDERSAQPLPSDPVKAKVEMMAELVPVVELDREIAGENGTSSPQQVGDSQSMEDKMAAYQVEVTLPKLEKVHEDPDHARKQALKDRAPLFPGAPSLPVGLEEQVKALQGNPAQGDRDMMQAQHKVAAAAREQVAEKAAAKAGAKKRKQKAVAKEKEKEEPAAKQPKTASDGEIDAENKEESKDGHTNEKPVNTRKPRVSTTTAEELANMWKEKEPWLANGGIPIPSGFNGQKKSYTLPAPNAELSSIGVLWTTSMLYVTCMKRPSDLVKTNKQGGCTVAIAKRGGPFQAWELAKFLAGWSS